MYAIDTAARDRGMTAPFPSLEDAEPERRSLKALAEDKKRTKPIPDGRRVTVQSRSKPTMA